MRAGAPYAARDIRPGSWPEPEPCAAPARAGPYRHVLCVYPYRNELKRLRYFPPLGLEVIAAALKPHAERIEVVDLRYEAGRTRDFLTPRTDLVCFSINWKADIDFIREEIRSVPDGPLRVVGGRHATEAPEEWLEACPEIDVLVRGDGEEVVRQIAGGAPFERIPGVSYRRDGRTVHNPHGERPGPAPDIRPDRALRRYRYEVDINGFATGLGVDSVAASRGCPFNCRFCSFSRNPWGEKRPWTARSPESVADELEEIEAENVVFTDDIFTHDMDRVEAICDEILRRGIRKRYIVNARIEAAKRMDVVRKMERAGFIALFLGVESAHDKTLRSMNKGFDTRRIREYFRDLRKSRMILHCYFIVGSIGETEEEMLQVAPFARELGVDTLGLSRLRTTPHDGMGELIARSPGYHVSPDGFVYSDAVSKDRINEIRRTIARRFYTARHMAKLAWKCARNRVLGPRLVWSLARIGLRATAARRRQKRQRQQAKGGQSDHAQ